MNMFNKGIEISEAIIQFVSLVDQAANGRPLLITKATNNQAQIFGYGRILKADNDTHYVTGVVYEPGVKDAHGNFMREEEIRNAAHWFYQNSGRADIQHSFKETNGLTVVESYVAPCDMTIGSEPVAKGSWVMTLEVADAEIWKAVQTGKLTGLSMGGTCRYGAPGTVEKNGQHYLHGLIL